MLKQTAGCYTASHLLKHCPSVHIDLLDRLPIPFGLVRLGVAPDHPEVKNVIHKFESVLSHPNVRFLGNVGLGNVSLSDLRQCYHAIVLAYGASKDRKLGIPGESQGSISSSDFVGWYNGHPSCVSLKPDLSAKSAIVIGHGNVALDIARMLLSPISLLHHTDMTQYALESLRKSNINRVHLVGRRGPLQVCL